jgi:hypothetical protein
MADIDWQHFAATLADRRAALARADAATQRDTAAACDALTEGALDAALLGQPVGAGDYLLLCWAHTISARAFVTTSSRNSEGKTA